MNPNFINWLENQGYNVCYESWMVSRDPFPFYNWSWEEVIKSYE